MLIPERYIAKIDFTFHRYYGSDLLLLIQIPLVMPPMRSRLLIASNVYGYDPQLDHYCRLR